MGAYSSVSCLHAIEHFGLGRYTDTVSVVGHIAGFDAIVDLFAPGGTLYMSFPIGKARVEFDAHRVFDPSDILEWSKGRLTLRRFDDVDDAGVLRKDAQPADAAALRWGCGIYTLAKAAA